MEDTSDLISRAFNTIVTPLMREKISECMKTTYGVNWWDDKAYSIMQEYSFINKIVIKDLTNPLQSLDLSALLYLIFPYSPNDEIKSSTGLSNILKNYYKLSNDQINRIRNLRSIRNKSAHVLGLEENQNTIVLLGAIANTLKPIDKDISIKLEPIFVELNNRKNKQDKSSYEQTHLVRKMLKNDFTWEEAPIDQPIFLEIPWITMGELEAEYPDITSINLQSNVSETKSSTTFNVNNLNSLEKEKKEQNSCGLIKKIVGFFVGTIINKI